MADENKIARRTLFAGAGLLAAIGLAAKFAPKSPVQDNASSPAEEPKGDGYRLTEHVKKYYRTTTL